MGISVLKTFIASVVALFLGIGASFVTFVTPIQEEMIRFFNKPESIPTISEKSRDLSNEEQATMSASFIKEFEGMIASGTGERK